MAGDGKAGSQSGTSISAARTALLVAAILLLVWLAWTLSYVILLLFGAIVVATILLAAASFIERWTPLPKIWALALAELIIALVIGVFLYLLGSQIAAEFSSLMTQLPETVSSLGKRLNFDLMENLRQEASFSWIGNVVGFAPNLVGALLSLMLVLVGGVFVAAQPHTYREGVLKLVPEQQRERARATMLNAGNALRLWLVGKLVTMLLIGIVTFTGLSLLGIPSALTLGLIAGMMEFIPFLGPILSFVPAGLVALSHDVTSFWWVLGLYVVIQQTENNLLVPLIQQRTVDLPPVLGLFAIVALGGLFGPLGVVLAVPLTVVLMVAVKQLYLRDALSEEVHIPGEKGKKRQKPSKAD
jgi:predicted PurR-regulated permease PerM